MPTPPMTDEQKREAVAAWMDHGRSVRAAAAALGLNYHTYSYRLCVAKREGYAQSEGVASVISKAKLLPAEARGGWLHTYDPETGQKIGATRWANLDDAPDSEDRLAAIRAAFEGMQPVPPVTPPEIFNEDLCTIYPLADVHMGAMSWGQETGEDYDTHIASNRVRDWVARAVDASPASGLAIILDVGDLTHADDQTNQTPKSKHGLDVDTRHFRTLDVTIAALAYSVEYALQKHARVKVRILPGNHNPAAYLAVMFALAERYRNEPRVEVQKVPGEFFMHEFGKVMIAAHHGDKAKADRLVHFIADQYAEVWGRTKHRYLFTGHLHHHKSQDIGGCTWEQLRAVTARDAYAASHAYVARAQLQAITLHRIDGEVQRVKIGARAA